MVDGVDLTKKHVDVHGETESVDSDGMGSESSTPSIQGNADWDSLSFLSEG